MNENNKEILNELEKMEMTIKNIRDFIGSTGNIKIIKTEKEFNDAINKTASFLAKSENKHTVKGVKQRLLHLKKFPNVKEAYEIQELYGIPIYAWRDIEWFRKTLLPHKD